MEYKHTESEMRKLMWKNFGYGFFAGAAAMAIISLLVITINVISCFK